MVGLHALGLRYLFILEQAQEQENFRVFRLVSDLGSRLSSKEEGERISHICLLAINDRYRE